MLVRVSMGMCQWDKTRVGDQREDCYLMQVGGNGGLNLGGFHGN